MVEYVSGKREVIRWADEAETYGSLPATGLILLKNAKITPNVTQEWEPIPGAGTGNITQTYEAGVQDVKFTLSYNPQDWRLLVMAMGYTDNVDETGNYSHSFMYKTAKDLESFSVQRIKNITTDEIETYRGCKINSWNISWNAAGGGVGKFIECSFDCWAKDLVGTDTEKTAETTNNTNAILQSRQVVAIIDGTSYTACVSGNIRGESKLGPDDGFHADASATTTRSETEPQMRTITGTIALRYTDSTFFDHWKTGAVIGTSQVTGTATSSTNTTLVDSGSGWDVNDYQLNVVRITAGTGVGQVRVVMSNTSDTLTVNRAWDTNPSTDSTFSVLAQNSIEFRRTAATDYALFTFANFRIDSVTDPTEIEGFNMVTLNFKADEVEVEVEDDRSDYYATA